jgi:hypothetical protein
MSATSARRARRRVVTLLLLGAFVLGGCGIPLDASAKPLSGGQAGLLNGTQTPSTSPKPGSTPFDVFFIRDGQLYPVRRYLNSSTLSINALATAALSALNDGPSANEIRQGITSALLEVPHANVRISVINTKGHFVQVALDSEFVPPNLFGTRLAQAYAQIVYTLTSSVFAKQLSGVEFELNGNTWPAYLPNGSFGGVVGQHDYEVFRPIVSPNNDRAQNARSSSTTAATPKGVS